MKKLVAILAVVALMATIVVASGGCGSGKTVNGQYCDTYGLINKDEMKCEGVQYRVITGNIVWGIILVETIVAPVYFFGFSLYEPVGVKVPKKAEK